MKKKQLRREIRQLRQDLEFAEFRIAENLVDHLAEQVKAPRCLSLTEAEAAYQIGFSADDDGHPERHDLGVLDVARAAERKLIGALLEHWKENPSLSEALQQALDAIGAPKPESATQPTQGVLSRSERTWLEEHRDFHEAISEELCCSAHNGAGPFSVILNTAKKLVAEVEQLKQKLDASEAEVRELSDKACGIIEESFQECPSCAAKPGSPELCEDCLRRRTEFYSRPSRRSNAQTRLERMTAAAREVHEAQARYRVDGEGYPLQLMKAIDALVDILGDPRDTDL